MLLVIDQAYAEYVDPRDDDGALALAAAHANVLVTRTFSKAYGLAGERVGWATGAEALIEVLNRIRGPFNLSNSAQATCLAAVGDQAFVEHSRRHNAEVRAQFRRGARGARQSRRPRGAERGQFRAAAVRGQADRRGGL